MGPTYGLPYYERGIRAMYSEVTPYNDDDDSLPDTFSLWEPKRSKTLGTKEDQDEEDTQTQTMNTDMPELIFSDEEAAPQKTFTTKKPPWKKPPQK